MIVFEPEYYGKFCCIAAACPDSCCKEWEVDVDDEAASRYRAMPGALGDRLRQVLRDTEGGTIMTIENGRCPMWRQDGLCRIQAECGHDALCKTCREFPRLRHDYGDFVELGLELSCPEAAQLILSVPAGPMISREIPGGEAPEYDEEAMEILRRSREQALALLSDPRYSLPQALAILLLFGHDVQAQLDGCPEAPWDPDAALEEARGYAKQGDMVLIFRFFGDLEILTPAWKTRLSAPPSLPRWEPSHRAMARYMVERYWLQAVSDYDIICRVKLCIIACLLVAALGGDPVETAQQFSKEIENNPDNVEAILDGAYRSPALTDLQLISLLLKG